MAVTVLKHNRFVQNKFKTSDQAGATKHKPTTELYDEQASQNLAILAAKKKAELKAKRAEAKRAAEAAAAKQAEAAAKTAPKKEEKKEDDKKKK